MNILPLMITPHLPNEMKVVTHDNKTIKVDTFMFHQETKTIDDDIFYVVIDYVVIDKDILPFKTGDRNKIGWVF